MPCFVLESSYMLSFLYPFHFPILESSYRIPFLYPFHFPTLLFFHSFHKLRKNAEARPYFGGVIRR